MAMLAQGGVHLDTGTQTVSIAVAVNRPTNDVEYLLIHQKGKKHESILITQVEPELLNAGLLALGLQPGENAQRVDKDPMPSMEELKSGVSPFTVVPPKGMPVFMTLGWQDAQGQAQQMMVEDLIYDWEGEEAVTGNQWIFLGGRMAAFYRGDPPVFAASMEGNLISVCYMEPPNHLLTMRHPHARWDANWWVAKACPDPGTEAILTFHRRQPQVARRPQEKPADRPEERTPTREGK